MPWRAKPRFEYSCAVYHVMARGGGGKPIFVGKDDHESFLYWLERVAERLAMGHPASMSQHVNRMRKEPKADRQLKKHEQTLKSKD
jgi:hypothetical protein